MNPKPFSALNHFTAPTVISVLLAFHARQSLESKVEPISVQTICPCNPTGFRPRVSRTQTSRWFFFEHTALIVQHFFYNTSVRRRFLAKFKRSSGGSTRRLIAPQQLVSRALKRCDVALGSFNLLAHHVCVPARLIGDVAILDRLATERAHPSVLIIIAKRLVLLLGHRGSIARCSEFDDHRAQLALNPLRGEALAWHGLSLG